MKTKKHLVVQGILWLLVWVVMSLNQQDSYAFLMQRSTVYLVQIILLITASYIIIPKLLFKKKHVWFILISITVVILSAWFVSQLNISPPRELKPPLHRGPRPASGFFVHLLLISISYITCVLVEIYIYANEKEKSIVIAKAELMESELKLLKMQINPHFLFNALNNIYSLSVKNSDKTQDGISTLSEMLRYVIYDCEQPTVSIEKEVNYIENYIHLFKFRSKEHFNIQFEHDIQNPRIKLAPMLLIPFIENAFKHSGIEKRGDAFIHIQLIAKDNHIKFFVENSLDTINNRNNLQSGIGLTNVKKRLALTYPNSYDLNVEDFPTFKVELKILIDE